MNKWTAIIQSKLEFLHLNETIVINEELYRPDRGQVHLKENAP